jgi:hypothetical protein
MTGSVEIQMFLNNFQLFSCFFFIGYLSLRRRTRAFPLKDSRRLAPQKTVEGVDRPHVRAGAATTADREDPAVVVGFAEAAWGAETAIRHGRACGERARRGHGAPPSLSSTSSARSTNQLRPDLNA